MKRTDISPDSAASSPADGSHPGDPSEAQHGAAAPNSPEPNSPEPKSAEPKSAEPGNIGAVDKAKLGKFITLEGVEGAGKSTQARLLRDRLEASGHKVVLTREPGGSPRAEEIRDLLLSGRIKPFGALAEAALFYVARNSHLEITIRPALNKGQWVVCDRFSDSTRAYQGAGGDVPVGVLDALERAVVWPTRPDLTLILDLPAEIGLQRLQARADGMPLDRFELEGLAFHENLRAEFLEIARSEPWRCAVINAARPPEIVAQDVWSLVTQRLQP
jgi:dTMP kinase